MEKNRENDNWFYFIITLFMQSCKRFEELEIRKLWIQLTKELSNIFYDQAFRNFSFQDQIMRACISITNNIAEWFESWSKKEFIKFLYYSKRSTWEVRSMLYVAENLKYIDNLQFQSLSNSLITIAVKIYNLISSLSRK
jgi:four helix bundle protein